MSNAEDSIIVFDEAQVKLPLWKRFYLWAWGRCHRRHVSIWLLKEEKENEPMDTR